MRKRRTSKRMRKLKIKRIIVILNIISQIIFIKIASSEINEAKQR